MRMLFNANFAPLTGFVAFLGSFELIEAELHAASVGQNLCDFTRDNQRQPSVRSGFLPSFGPEGACRSVGSDRALIVMVKPR